MGGARRGICNPRLEKIPKGDFASIHDWICWHYPYSTIDLSLSISTRDCDEVNSNNRRSTADCIRHTRPHSHNRSISVLGFDSVSRPLLVFHRLLLADSSREKSEDPED